MKLNLNSVNKNVFGKDVIVKAQKPETYVVIRAWNFIMTRLHCANYTL